MRSVIVVGAVAVVAMLAGCTVRGRGAAYTEEPVGTTYITSAPAVAYDTYPHTVYEGRTVYYVDGRWGYPHQGRFVYYRNEPPPLVRYRTQVREAPPARRYDRGYEQREYVQPAPNSPPASAPPAVRTR